MPAFAKAIVNQWAPGTPLPEHDWFWRRIFSYIIIVATVICQMIALWMMYELIHLMTFYVTKAAEETQWMTLKLQTIVQVSNAIIPPAMETFKWYVILQSFTVVLITTYYLIAPSAETLKAMTVAIASINKGAQISTSQIVSTPDAVAQTQTSVNSAPTPTPTPTPTPAG